MDINENEVIDLTSYSYKENNEFWALSKEDCIRELKSEKAYLEEMVFLIKLNEKQIQDEINSELPDENVIGFIRNKIEDFEKQKGKIKNNITEIESVMIEKGYIIQNYISNQVYDNFNYLSEQISTLYLPDMTLINNHSQNLFFNSNASCVPDIELGYQYCTQ